MKRQWNKRKVTKSVHCLILTCVVGYLWNKVNAYLYVYELKFIVSVIFELLYLQNSSDILGLIQVMIMTFGERPPVYAKQRPDMISSTPYPTQREYCHYILSVLEFFCRFIVVRFISKTEHDWQ